MRHLTRSLFLLIMLIAVTSAASADQSCEAEAAIGGTCKVNCGPGETAECRGGLFRSRCTCVQNEDSVDPGGDTTTGSGLAYLSSSTIAIHGHAAEDAALRVEILDISCEQLPCAPELLAAAIVDVTAGQSAADLRRAVVSSLLPPAGCRVTRDQQAFKVSCAGFMPKVRICKANRLTCRDVFEYGGGTDPDLGINKLGFSFQTLEAETLTQREALDAMLGFAAQE